VFLESRLYRAGGIPVPDDANIPGVITAGPDRVRESIADCTFRKKYYRTEANKPTYCWQTVKISNQQNCEYQNASADQLCRY